MDKDTHFINNPCLQEHTVEGPPAVNPDSVNAVIPVQHRKGGTHIDTTNGSRRSRPIDGRPPPAPIPVRSCRDGAPSLLASARVTLDRKRPPVFHLGVNAQEVFDRAQIASEEGR